MNIAVILAGGSGTRLGAEKPKQFLEVGGRTILEHTVRAFDRNERIGRIIIVSRQDYVDVVKQTLSAYPKVTDVLCGGKERYHSSLAAIQACDDDEDCLLLHDCVRPLVSQRIINDCLDALEKYDAVDVAVPATDTIIEVDDNGCIARIPQRSHLRNVQTPQCFRMRTIKKAFDLALKDPDFIPTDDCSVVHRYLPDTPIVIVPGESTNIKVTYAEDLQMVERIVLGKQTTNTPK